MPFLTCLAHQTLGYLNSIYRIHNLKKYTQCILHILFSYDLYNCTLVHFGLLEISGLDIIKYIFIYMHVCTCNSFIVSTGCMVLAICVKIINTYLFTYTVYLAVIVMSEWLVTSLYHLLFLGCCSPIINLLGNGQVCHNLYVYTAPYTTCLYVLHFDHL